MFPHHQRPYSLHHCSQPDPDPGIVRRDPSYYWTESRFCRVRFPRLGIPPTLSSLHYAAQTASDATAQPGPCCQPPPKELNQPLTNTSRCEQNATTKSRLRPAPRFTDTAVPSVRTHNETQHTRQNRTKTATPSRYAQCLAGLRHCPATSTHDRQSCPRCPRNDRPALTPTSMTTLPTLTCTPPETSCSWHKPTADALFPSAESRRTQGHSCPQTTASRHHRIPHHPAWSERPTTSSAYQVPAYPSAPWELP